MSGFSTSQGLNMQKLAKVCTALCLFFIFTQFFVLKGEQEVITSINKKIAISSAYFGACFIDAETHEVLFSHNASKLFIPASITKLFTAAAALEFLGPDHTFETTVYTSEQPDQRGNISGNAYLVGSGDPSLETRHLKSLAAMLRAKGITRISGSIIADDSLFQSAPPIHSEWEDLVEAYSPECSPLSVNDNMVKITVTPHPSGKGLNTAHVDQDVEYCQLINKINTSTHVTEAEISAKRGFTNNVIELSGAIPLQSDKTSIKVAIHQPAEYARQLFVNYLIKEGITIGDFPFQKHQDLYEIASQSSPPLSFLIAKMNKTSHNLTAELIFRAIGAAGLTPQNTILQQARLLTSAYLEQLAIKSDAYQLYDGSGLSRHNLVSPQQVITLLSFLKNSPHSKVFIDSLAVPDEVGSLLNRFNGHKFDIKAKTGSMSGTSNLAGFATAASGRKVIFAVFVNHSTDKWQKITEELDEMVIGLLEVL